MCFRTPVQYMAAHMHQFTQIAGFQPVLQFFDGRAVSVFAMMFMFVMVSAVVLMLVMVSVPSVMIMLLMMMVIVRAMLLFQSANGHTFTGFGLLSAILPASPAASQRIQRAMSIALIAVSCHNSSSFLALVPK